MFSVLLDSAWGSGPNKNTHAVVLPPAAQNLEYFLVSFEARHYLDPLSWKLRDASGCERHLPYFCRRSEFTGLSITVYGSTGGSYKYDCKLEAWPKDLQMPIPKFHSISTVQISPQEKGILPPIGRYRRKGAKNWEIGSLVTFDTLNDVYESQLFYNLKTGQTVESPILEVTCLGKSFDIEKETVVDLEQMLINKNFGILHNQSVSNTKYTESIKLISPTDSEEYNKEIIITSHKIIQRNIPIIFGAQYEYKIHVDNFAKSFSRVIQVPATHVDKNLWTTLFGSADQVTFYKRHCEVKTRWIDWYAGEGDEYDSDIEKRYLVLYKHGAYSYKYTFQEIDSSKIIEKSNFGGSFTLTANTNNNFRIELRKIFSKDSKGPRPMLNFSNVGSGSQPLSPAPLQLPEIIDNITSYIEYITRISFRRVCKTWCKAIQPTTSGPITAKTVSIYSHDLGLESNNKTN